MKPSQVLPSSLLLFLASCGIKAKPEPLPRPQVDIKRVGHLVLVKSLEGDVRVKGFEREGLYWVKREQKAFCFVVERVGGKGEKVCVKEGLKEKPSYRLVEEGAVVKIYPSGFTTYYLYPEEGGKPAWEKGKKFYQSLEVEREYVQRCYFLTGVKEGVESEPAELCIKPKPPPYVAPVERLELRLGELSLYLVWFYEKPYREFLVYENGRLLGSTTGFSYEVKKPSKPTTYEVRVVSPEGFESQGVQIFYNP